MNYCWRWNCAEPRKNKATKKWRVRCARNVECGNWIRQRKKNDLFDVEFSQIIFHKWYVCVCVCSLRTNAIGAVIRCSYCHCCCSIAENLVCASDDIWIALTEWIDDLLYFRDMQQWRREGERDGATRERVYSTKRRYTFGKSKPEKIHTAHTHTQTQTERKKMWMIDWMPLNRQQLVQLESDILYTNSMCSKFYYHTRHRRQCRQYIIQIFNANDGDTHTRGLKPATRQVLSVHGNRTMTRKMCWAHEKRKKIIFFISLTLSGSLFLSLCLRHIRTNIWDSREQRVAPHIKTKTKYSNGRIPARSSHTHSLSRSVAEHKVIFILI